MITFPFNFASIPIPERLPISHLEENKAPCSILTDFPHLSPKISLQQKRRVPPASFPNFESEAGKCIAITLYKKVQEVF